MNSSGRRGRLVGSLIYILADLGRGTGPGGEKMAGACPAVDSQDLATILEPFSPILGQTAYLRLVHCDIATIEISETSTLCAAGSRPVFC